MDAIAEINDRMWEEELRPINERFTKPEFTPFNFHAEHYHPLTVVISTIRRASKPEMKAAEKAKAKKLKA